MSSLSICVFCGSRPGARPSYVEAARATGAVFARNGWRLVYGAGDVGIMGAVAHAAISAGAATLGVIPTHLLGKERETRDRANLVITEDMHERKKVMFMNSDAVVVLPGGAGSMDEFFEVLTWAQIGLHAKPILLLDVEGYWRPLLALIDHVIAEGFAAPSLKRLFTVVPDVPSLEATLVALRPPAMPAHDAG
ncbi:MULTISPECIES: LOG family protein [Tabrizicola]|uniref:LOG family protein n=1 Tax=Tabrizicola TaxID=1443919 RepID=UPI0010810EB3|nr:MULTISPECIES: TIGR00730 family Rossman fold protein [Paracoccaceae]